MAKEPARLPGVRGKTPILHKLAYELRYREGYTYLDKCGRVLNKIQQFSPEWVIQGDVNPQSASLVSIENAAVFTFSSTGLSLGMEMALGKDPLNLSDVKAFTERADDLTGLVTDLLGIGALQITRVGFRMWFLFPCRDKRDSEQWLRELGCYRLSESFVAAFGEAVESVVASIVIEGKDRAFRIGLSGAERQAQLDLGQGILSLRPRDLPKGQREFLQDRLKAQHRVRQNPDFVAVVDIDCYQEDPQILEVRHFLESSWGEAYSRFQRAVAQGAK